VLSQLVLLMAIVVGVTFVGQLRRGDPGQRGYLVVLGGVSLVAVVAALRGDRFLSLVAVGLSLLVVVVPWLLDLLVRACFGRERLAWAVRLAGLRALLMPGAGLHRQQTILHGLLVLEQRGVDGALAYFRSLAHETEDDTERRVIHEQIVSMLLFGQRWSEGIAHYEARFAPGYAAQRPPLALGLLRAYGESGKLGRAAGLLRAIEELLGRDPRAAGVVSQARLTFLAYAGRNDPVASALTEERRRRLGLSAASGALFRGIALLRAGQVQAAHAELRRVEDLAGARDERVVDASRKAIARAVDEPAAAAADVVELPPELRSYAERVADRLEGFLAAAPAIRRSGSLWVTPALLLVLGLGYAAVLVLDAGGAGLLRLGATTPELVRAGAWGRLLTGVAVQTEPLALLLSVYGVWLAGPLVERVYGRGRTLVVSLGAAVAGLAAAVALTPQSSAVLGGGALLTTGLVTSALWVLLSPRINLPRRTRRVLALPLVLLLLALVVTIPRSGAGLDVSAVGMVVAAVVGMLGVGLAPPQGHIAAMARGVAGALLLAVPVAAVSVAREDPHAFVLAHRRTVTAAGVVLHVPERFVVVQTEREPTADPWPIYPGLHDTLAQRVGDRVQVLITPTRDGTMGPSALLRVDPGLGHALVEVAAPAPAAWGEAWSRATAPGSEATTPDLRTTVLRRNGQDVGVVIERALGQGVSVVLVAAPPAALAHDAALYAAVLADAQPPR
jgi:membrane associated rhomboid family serine protease